MSRLALYTRSTIIDSVSTIIEATLKELELGSDTPSPPRTLIGQKEEGHDHICCRMLQRAIVNTGNQCDATRQSLPSTALLSCPPVTDLPLPCIKLMPCRLSSHWAQHCPTMLERRSESTERTRLTGSAIQRRTTRHLAGSPESRSSIVARSPRRQDRSLHRCSSFALERKDSCPLHRQDTWTWSVPDRSIP